MTIAEMREASNKAVSRVPTDVLVVAVVLLASSASFGLGLLAGKGTTGKGNGFWIENVASTTAPLEASAAAAAIEASLPPIPTVATGTQVAPETGKYVASKNGTKYYLPSCSGANRIKESNKVWFASAADAQKAGLTAAANCPGL